MPNRNQVRPAVSKPAPDLTKDLWSPLEVARYLELAPNTVYAMLGRQEVPGQIRFGRHWKISVPKLMRSIHGETRQAS